MLRHLLRDMPCRLMEATWPDLERPAKLKLHLLFSKEKRHNPFIYSCIESYPSNFLKTVGVASRPPFFEPKARRKEHGGLEATPTSLDRTFFLGRSGAVGGGAKLKLDFQIWG